MLDIYIYVYAYNYEGLTQYSKVWCQHADGERQLKLVSACTICGIWGLVAKMAFHMHTNEAGYMRTDEIHMRTDEIHMQRRKLTFVHTKHWLPAKGVVYKLRNRVFYVSQAVSHVMRIRHNYPAKKTMASILINKCWSKQEGSQI